MKTKSRSIGHIVKQLNGKRLPRQDKHDRRQRIQFPDNRSAATAVWTINEETGREASNFDGDGTIVTVWT